MYLFDFEASKKLFFNFKEEFVNVTSHVFISGFEQIFLRLKKRVMFKLLILLC